MFLVIMGHCHIHSSQSIITQFIYSFHMAFFFFISGFLCKRILSFSSIKKDIQYILVPYFTFGLLYFLWNIIRSNNFTQNYSIIFLESLIIGKDCSIGPIWFLPALFVCKQLFLIIDLLKKWNPVLYYVSFALSFIPSYYISLYRFNIPFFIDSALMGLPFFIFGNISSKKTSLFEKLKNPIRLLASMVLLFFSIALSYCNGFVVIADCIIGESIFLYYLNSITAIISLSLLFMGLNRFSSFYIKETSYGSIVILGLHGFILTFFNYYLPLLLESKPQTYNVIMAIFYSVITHFCCFVFIVYIDKRCPYLFGLKGLKKNNH